MLGIFGVWLEDRIEEFLDTPPELVFRLGERLSVPSGFSVAVEWGKPGVRLNEAISCSMGEEKFRLGVPLKSRVPREE